MPVLQPSRKRFYVEINLVTNAMATEQHIAVALEEIGGKLWNAWVHRADQLSNPIFEANPITDEDMNVVGTWGIK